jgi:hypothetical protein
VPADVEVADVVDEADDMDALLVDEVPPLPPVAADVDIPVLGLFEVSSPPHAPTRSAAEDSKMIEACLMVAPFLQLSAGIAHGSKEGASTARLPRIGYFNDILVTVSRASCYVLA